MTQVISSGDKEPDRTLESHPDGNVREDLRAPRPTTGDGPGPAVNARQSVPVGRLLELVGKVLAPTSLLAALAYHFGREMTFTRTYYFGIDPSVLGFSAQDYIVRSADALFVPLGAILLAAGACLLIHVVLLWCRSRFSVNRIRVATWVVLTLGSASLLVGVASVFWDVPIVHRFYLWGPLSPAIGALLIFYGCYLFLAVTPSDTPGSLKAIMPSWLPSAGVILVAAAVVLSLFWSATEYAHALGLGRARSLGQDLSRLPRATVYSKERHILAGPGVAEGLIYDTDAAFRFRYTGLRFFIRSNDRYFLLPELWSSTQGAVFVLSDAQGIRLEFQPGRS